MQGPGNYVLILDYPVLDLTRLIHNYKKFGQYQLHGRASNI